ncbi:MAG TPA: GTP cyclohydrolase I FolE [Saprospiraceae bacterium]|nr:GTP cyclohydrolase I FolE [Saprospiraceae bacterium]
MSFERIDSYDDEVTGKIADNYSEVLIHLGEDVKRQGLIKTPERASKAIQFLTQGYRMDAREIIQKAIFDEDYKEMVVVKDIELYSLCEHHILPFFGKAHVAYIPNGKICGLSKIPRVVDAFSRKLQVQERLTLEIRDCLEEALSPLGVAVVIEAQHMCMMIRGVEKQNSSTTTSAFTGEFNRQETRSEFLKLITNKLR